MLQPAERLKIISRVKATVLRHHFNFWHVNYAEWSKVVEEQWPSLLIGDDDEFENGVRKLLSELKSSHTKFYGSDADAMLPQHAIGATLRSEPYHGAPRWMVLDVFEGSPAAGAGLKPGQFLVSLDTVSVLPPIFPIFHFGQQHHLITESPVDGHRDIILFVASKRRKSGRPPLVCPDASATAYWGISDC
jgi:hypothetical protein